MTRWTASWASCSSLRASEYTRDNARETCRRKRNRSHVPRDRDDVRVVCATHRKALGRVDGVSEAHVNLATEKAHVVFNPAQASMDQMRAAVEKAGYAIGALPEPIPAEAQSDAPLAQTEDVY